VRFNDLRELVNVPELIFWCSLVLLFNIYIGYPLVLASIATFSSRELAKTGRNHYKISVLVAAHNEESTAADKIRNTLGLDYPIDDLELVIVSDGSTDNTNAILTAMSSPRVKVNLSPVNQGKTVAMNEAANRAEGEILVFTDANVIIAPDALQKISNAFADETIGCVCGTLTYTNANTSINSCAGSMYWKYEELVKRLESRTGSVIGADGALFAIRRELFTPLKSYLIDDFTTSVLVLTQGYRVVVDPAVRVFETYGVDVRDEFRRKRRIANRMYTAIRYVWPRMRSISYGLRVRFILHRILRYWTFPLLILTFVSNLSVARYSSFFTVFASLQVVWYVLALLGAIWSQRGRRNLLVKAPFMLTTMFCAQFLGVIDSLRGKRYTRWSPPSTAR
jgi:cellulose synthase/poly-beta-1,6-N-acetylglucosamine synthase-like glycosyltransferase